MGRKNKVKIALITYWFYPNTIVAARRFRGIHQQLADYPDLQLDIFTGSFNRECSIQDRYPVDLTNVKYIKLYKNSFEKNIFSNKNSFYHLLNRTIFLGAAERRFGRAIHSQKELESYDIFYLSLGPFCAQKTEYPPRKIYKGTYQERTKGR